MKKICKKFKIFPVKGEKEFYTVYIFNNRFDMRSFSNELHGKISSSRFQAVTHSYDAYNMINGKKVPSKNIGSILFYEGGFGHGIVSHEIAHAINYFFLKRKLPFNLGSKHNLNWAIYDETYATMLGYMVNQFWKKYNGKIHKEIY